MIKDTKDPHTPPSAHGVDTSVHPIAEFVRKNKSEVIVGAILVVCLVVGIGGYLIYGALTKAHQQTQDASYRQSHTYHYKEGDTIELDPVASEGDAKATFSGFGGSGTMEASLQNLAVFDTLDQAGFQKSEAINASIFDQMAQDPRYAQGYKVVVCTLLLTNKDAQGILSAQELPSLGDDARYAFSSSAFTLAENDANGQVSNAYELPDFAQGLIPNPPPSWNYLFTLLPGKEKTLKLAYLVPAQYAQDSYTFKIGIDGSPVQYLVDADAQNDAG